MLAFRNLLLVGPAFLFGFMTMEFVQADATNTVANVADENETAVTQTPPDSGWRRTNAGWVQTAGWLVPSSGTDEAPATKLHPALIVAFVVLVSFGGLVAFDPVVRKRRQWIKSDEVLIREWSTRMRRHAEKSHGDFL